MKPFVVCYSLSTMKPTAAPQKAVLALGNFDGVHLGHRTLLSRTKELCQQHAPGAVCGVFSFSTPSTEYLSPMPHHQISTLEERLFSFRECGMEYAFIADFPTVRDLPPNEFISNVLIDTCHCVGAVCGYNFFFGKGGNADGATMKQLADFPVVIQEEVCYGNVPVSSTRIRTLLSKGKVQDAALLLTHPYSFTAPVLHGKALGHKLGSPTVNQQLPPCKVIPAHGVYVTDCHFDGKVFRAVSNVGVRPTTDRNSTVNCESYLLDFDGDLYGKEITVFFLEHIRDEVRFSSLEELKEQIRQDVFFAKNYQ